MLENRSPLVSILVPTYNEEVFIAKCVESILKQDYANFELIIFDDCSTDNTVNIIESIKDERLSLVKNPKNEKHEKTWNELLLKATGKYVKVICADDLIMTDCVSKSVKALEENPESVMAFCGKNIIDPSGRIFYSPLMSEAFFQDKSSHAIMRTSLLKGTNVIGEPNNVLFRRTAVEEGVRFRFSNYWMVDPDFYIQLAPLGNFTYVPKRLTAFRISLKSWSVLFSYRQARLFKQYINQQEIQQTFNFSKSEIRWACLNALKLQLLRQIAYIVIMLRSSILTKK